MLAVPNKLSAVLHKGWQVSFQRFSLCRFLHDYALYGIQYIIDACCILFI